MRWYWIDRYLEFESGRRARAIKNVSLAEEHLHDHFPGYSVMPNSLVIEGFAQTGGLLVCEHNRFQRKVVLAKLPYAIFHGPVLPGDTLTYVAQIEYLRDDGAMVTAEAYRGEELLAEAELVFAQLGGEHEGKTFYEPRAYLRMMRLLKTYEIGRAADGSPLREPEELVRAAARED